MKNISVEVITPSKAAYKNEAVSVTLPGEVGNFQVLFNHAPIISSLSAGELKIVEPDGTHRHFAVGGGTVEVLDNKVLILAESIELPEEIDSNRAEEALKRAKERLAHKTKEIDTARAEAALKRALNRLKMKEKYL